MDRAVLFLILNILCIPMAIAGQRDMIPASINATADSVNKEYPVSEHDTCLSAPDANASVEIPAMLEPTTGTYVEHDWRYHLRQRTLSVNDTSIRWPGFVDFCLRTYRWFDRVFNSHDPLWVRKDQYPCKIILTSDNWADAYFIAPNNGPGISMMSRLYANLGIHLKYSVLSIGYSADMNSIFAHEPSRHKKWNFGINCARFNIDINLWHNYGTSYIRRFGDYNRGKEIHLPFEGLDFKALDIYGFYIFNNRKFSLGSTYSFSNNQIRSCGSALLGLDFSTYSADFDFTLLPDELDTFHKFPLDHYRFHYWTYSLIGGYSFNWVLNRNLCFNISALPGIGLTSSKEDSTLGTDTLAAVNLKGMMALLYSHKHFFACARASFSGNFFMTKEIKFLNNVQNYQLSLGIMF